MRYVLITPAKNEAKTLKNYESVKSNNTTFAVGNCKVMDQLTVLMTFVMLHQIPVCLQKK